MRRPYGDMYSLFRHEPAAEEYFNGLPGHLQNQIAARYQAVDSLERLQDYAQRLAPVPHPPYSPPDGIR